ncbi:MAG: AAA family ATPase [Humidesulfovibrio sp.]|nr:AAA family ATPase [Humidesulfovibrio sp.]
MNHYAGQGLEREPFSSSPDPNFLLATRQHATCLQELEISLRLRRGLNVVTGDIGTGKTTLCRSLLRTFAADAATDVHLLLDPHFETSEEFLRVILASVSGHSPEPGLGLWAMKETLKQQLFRLGLVEKRLVILVIDEGQKISLENLEILREMLNFETNTSKLLQIVLFGQRELEPMIEAMPNLADRINVRRRLRPLSFVETRRMIRHRLAVAAGISAPLVRFTLPAMAAIHLASGGSPRKAVRLCHMALMEMLVRGRLCVGLFEVRAATRVDPGTTKNPRRTAGLAAIAAICFVFGGLWFSLSASGPVLGPAAHGQKSLPGSQEVQSRIGTDGVTALPETRDASMTTEGLSLRADAPGHEDEASNTGGRVSLLPQQDQGPNVRSKVDTNRAPLLEVRTPEQNSAVRAVFDPGKARPLALRASLNPDNQ